MRKAVTGLLAALAMLFAGCAAVPMADPAMDAEMKTFAPAPEKVRLYVYRNESFGAAIKMPVVLDGKILGDTAAQTYLFAEIEPGNHQLVSKTENDSTLDWNAV